jgi:Ca2+-binding EF-hand superfamily protein
MRKKLIGLVLFGGLVAALLIPTLGIGQQPPRSTGGGGGGPWDSSKMFDKMANGKDYVVISDFRMGRDEALQWAKDNGINNGQMTREQFANYFSQVIATKFQGIGKGGKGGKGKGGNQNIGGAGVDPDEFAVIRFKQLDLNGDGFLNEDEMSPKLRAVWKQYDKNGDGLIDVEEYKAYMRDIRESRNTKNAGSAAVPIEDVIEFDLDKRPTVFRAGKLPEGLPDWFAKYDTDGDGQVGLYEWRKGGKPIAEFQLMDRNGDGLLTAEEVLWYYKLQAAKNGGNPSGSESVVAQGDQPRLNPGGPVPGNDKRWPPKGKKGKKGPKNSGSEE